MTSQAALLVALLDNVPVISTWMANTNALHTSRPTRWNNNRRKCIVWSDELASKQHFMQKHGETVAAAAWRCDVNNEGK